MIDTLFRQDYEDEGIYSTFLIFALILSMLLLSSKTHEIFSLAIFFYVASIYRVFKQSFYNISKNRFAGLINLGILYGALVLFLSLSIYYSPLFVVFVLVLVNLVIKKYNIIFYHPSFNSL